MAQALRNVDRTKEFKLRTDAVGDYLLHSNGQKEYFFTTAITANSTATAAASGTWGRTSHATGNGLIFVSDGAKWQGNGSSIDILPVIAKPTTGAITITEDQAIFTNTGAVGTTTQTLPNSSVCTAGKTRFHLFVTVAQSFRVKPSGSDHLIGYFTVAPFDIDSSGDLRSNLIGAWLDVSYIGGTTWAIAAADGWA